LQEAFASEGRTAGAGHRHPLGPIFHRADL
jgi:hypothetical protein